MIPYELNRDDCCGIYLLSGTKLPERMHAWIPFWSLVQFILYFPYMLNINLFVFFFATEDEFESHYCLRDHVPV